MQTLLMFLIAVLTVAIFALAGFWFFRPDPVYKRRAQSPKVAPRAPRAINQVAKQVAWTITGRPFKDRA